MNKNYTTRNINVLSLKGDFKLFHDYIIDNNIFQKENQYHFDLINLSNEDKLNMLVDCVYELSIFKNGLQTTTEDFKALENYSFRTMYTNVLEIINTLKPYVLESDFLNEMNIRNYFRSVFDDGMKTHIKHKTKDNNILMLLDYFDEKDKEHETKASFYTAENKPQQKKHYTEETWFIVGLKFADGSVYENIENSKNQSDLARIVFGNTDYQPYINQTLSNINTQKNIYQRSKAKQELKKLYEFCIDTKIKMHPKFEEQYLIVQSKK